MQTSIWRRKSDSNQVRLPGAIGSVLLASMAVAAITSNPPAFEHSTPCTTTDETIFREGLAISSIARSGRSPIREDAIESLMVGGKWTEPKAGDTVTLPNGSSRAWQAVAAEADGSFNPRGFAGGYLYCTVTSDEPSVMILDAAGHSMVYVNGEPHTGDPYQHGYVHVPVKLRAGNNAFLFQAGRGPLRAKIVPTRGTAQFDLSDVTVPDLIVSKPVDVEAAVVVVNAAEASSGVAKGVAGVKQEGRALAGAHGRTLAIEATVPGGTPCRTILPPSPAPSMRKYAFRLNAAAPEAVGECEVELKLIKPNDNDSTQTLDTAKLKLRIVQAQDTHKQTFRSSIDGSLQYFAVVPEKVPSTESTQKVRVNSATPANEQQARPALILTLHGAGVEAFGQAVCYSAKPGVVTVAPTNRRPFGFDWEDWGRMDAMEVLDLAQNQFNTDPRRTYLTGHSMGGHGTWHVGATFPDRFAAIGPSAGWVSMFSYAGARRTVAQDEANSRDKIAEILIRCMSPSDTIALSRNYLHHGVYVLHGDKDDNVPVDEARTMKQQLEAMHKDFDYYEEPGAGHWWGKDLSEYATDGATWGTACVDWPPMFQFFGRHSTPAPKDVRHTEFTTANPGISARSHWATIWAQLVQLRPSSINIDCEPAARRFSGTTSNVAAMSLNVSHLSPNESIHIELDGQTLPEIAWPDTGTIWLNRKSDQWSVTSRPTTSLKGPHRYGLFKDAFRNRVLFVYATQGTNEENAWALAKARYDAEQFWYRGNGSIDLVSDLEFAMAGDGEGSKFADRNVVLYGNAESNSAWRSLLNDSPVQVRRGRVTVGNRELRGDDLGILFIRPRPGSDTASVGVVAGTGSAGMQLTERIPYFTSGVALPDLTIMGTESLTNGINGVRATGFFGPDWQAESGEIVWGNAD